MKKSIEDKIEEFKKQQEREDKKKRTRKRILIFSLTIITIVALFLITHYVREYNLSKLTNEYCQYNGEHPIENGMKSETSSMCRGCSKIMEFEYTITDELCEECAQELNRCKRCGGLLQN